MHSPVCGCMAVTTGTYSIIGGFSANGHLRFNRKCYFTQYHILHYANADNAWGI